MELSSRADIALVNSGLVVSRELAKLAIETGLVLYNGKRVLKPSQQIESPAGLTLTAQPLKYVGRGGLKLEKALSFFQINPKGLVCLDIGASTGGFTDCLLQNGASTVFAVDVGSGQLANTLKEDCRVVSMENTDFRNLEPVDFKSPAEFITADLSFISLKLLFPRISIMAPNLLEAVFLVKPQFEAGRSRVGKHGVVNDPKVHREVLNDIIIAAEEYYLYPVGLTYSPITGQDGNIEYLLYCRRAGEPGHFDINKIVCEAFSNNAAQERRRCK